MESQQGQPAVPFWLRGPWPFAMVIAACAAIWMGAAQSPFKRFDRELDDAILRARLKLGMAARPDGSIFLIGTEKNDLDGLSTIAGEYRNYAEIIDIANDLGAAVTAFDLILARGGPAEAEPVLTAARRGRGVVFAEADTGEKETLRSFIFAPREMPGGLVNIRADSDTVTRGYDYARLSGGVCRPSLALAVYLAARGSNADLNCAADGSVGWADLGPDSKSLVERRIPRTVALVNFRSSFAEPWDKGFKYLSLTDLRRKYGAWRVAKRAVPLDLPGAGSMVIVGSVAAGSGDSGPTPFGVNEPRVQVHAAALNDLVQGQMFRESGALFEAIAMVLAIALFTSAARLAKPWIAFGSLWFLSVSGSLLLGALLLIRVNLIFPAATLAAMLTLCFLAESGRRSAVTSLEKLRMRTTMAMYFSPRVMTEVLRNPGVMQPREAELTVLLTDLRNFTTITERFGTPVIFDLMNKVFEIETRSVIAMEGSMEHFLGDQFLGYWGAPQDQPDGSDRAMKAGRAIIDGLDQLKRTLPPDLAPLFGFGLAIHKGKALVGNKGSRERFDYGILGDIVNTAARVESLTKLYGVRWLITRDVLECQNGKPLYRRIDTVRVKGRSRSVELIEIPVEPSPDWDTMARKYCLALEAYTAGRFAEAGGQFEALEREYGDKPSHAMGERCRELTSAPPVNWDGAYTLKEK